MVVGDVEVERQVLLANNRQFADMGFHILQDIVKTFRVSKKQLNELEAIANEFQAYYEADESISVYTRAYEKLKKIGLSAEESNKVIDALVKDITQEMETDSVAGLANAVESVGIEAGPDPVQNRPATQVSAPVQQVSASAPAQQVYQYPLAPLPPRAAQGPRAPLPPLAPLSSFKS